MKITNIKGTSELIIIDWQDNYLGVGEIGIYFNKGKLEIDSEYMSNNEDKDFVKRVFNALVEQADIY